MTRLEQGGAPLALLETVRRMTKEDFDVEIAVGRSSDPDLELVDTPLVHGVKLIHIPSMRRNIHPIRDLQALWQLYKVIKSKRYHLVHTHTSKAGLLGRIAAHLCGVPVIIHSSHGTVLEGYFGAFTTRFFATLERLCAPLSDLLICLTPAEIDQCLEVRIGKRKQYTYIFNGIDIENFENRSGDRVGIRGELGIRLEEIVCIIVGRLVPVKGHDDLLNAFYHTLQKHQNIHLLIAGEGELRGDLEAQTERLGISAHVHFLGWREDTAELLGASDIFVLSSHNEGLGLVLIEAMTKHLPVVATDVGGVTHVVEHDQTGLLVPSHSPEKLSAALEDLLKDPAKRRQMGEAGYKRALEQFSINTTVENTEQVYLELTKSSP
jgi:glycosyltransferase involved in cell wall biosynthesis